MIRSRAQPVDDHSVPKEIGPPLLQPFLMLLHGNDHLEAARIGQSGSPLKYPVVLPPLHSLVPASLHSSSPPSIYAPHMLCIRSEHASAAHTTHRGQSEQIGYMVVLQTDFSSPLPARTPGS